MTIFLFIIGLVLTFICAGWGYALLYEQRRIEASIWALIACCVLAGSVYWFVSHAGAA